jgi:hypothetical protein
MGDPFSTHVPLQAFREADSAKAADQQPGHQRGMRDGADWRITLGKKTNSYQYQFKAFLNCLAA